MNYSKIYFNMLYKWLKDLSMLISIFHIAHERVTYFFLCWKCLWNASLGNGTYFGFIRDVSQKSSLGLSGTHIGHWPTLVASWRTTEYSTSHEICTWFSLVYFSVEVCLGGVCPHSVSTRRDSCIRVYAPLTLASPLTKKKNRTWGT